MNVFKVALILLVASILLISCGKKNDGPELIKTHDYSNRELPITVMVFESNSDLNKYLRSKDLTQRESKVEGLALWSLNAKDQTEVIDCTIYVVEPKGSQDYKELTTWGHELLHCVYGSFHKDGIR
jgi:hypothetical protein